MRPPGVLIDCLGEPNTPLMETPVSTGNHDIASLLLLYDYVTHPYCKLPPVMFRIGENIRRVVVFENAADQHFLSERGKIWASPATNDTVLEAYFNAQEGLEKLEDGRLGHVLIPQRLMDESDRKELCFECEFIRGITNPPLNTPLEAILDFKDRRNDEYLAFWEGMGEISNDIDWMAGQSPNLEFNKQVQKAWEEYEKVSAETWLQGVKNSVKLRLAIDGTTVAAFSGFASIQQYFRTDPRLVAMGILGMVKFSLDLLPSNSPLSDRARPMACVNMAKSIS